MTEEYPKDQMFEGAGKLSDEGEPTLLLENQLDHLQNLLSQADSEMFGRLGASSSKKEMTADDMEYLNQFLDEPTVAKPRAQEEESPTPTNILHFSTAENILDVLGLSEEFESKRKTKKENVPVVPEETITSSEERKVTVKTQGNAAAAALAAASAALAAASEDSKEAEDTKDNEETVLAQPEFNSKTESDQDKATVSEMNADDNEVSVDVAQEEPKENNPEEDKSSAEMELAKDQQAIQDEREAGYNKQVTTECTEKENSEDADLSDEPKEGKPEDLPHVDEDQAIQEEKVAESTEKEDSQDAYVSEEPKEDKAKDLPTIYEDHAIQEEPATQKPAEENNIKEDKESAQETNSVEVLLPQLDCVERDIATVASDTFIYRSHPMMSAHQHLEKLQKQLEEARNELSETSAALATSKALEIELRKELTVKRATYASEVKSRLQYRKALQEIAEVVQSRCKDNILTAKVMSIADRAEEEAMAVPDLKITDESNSMAESTTGISDDTGSSADTPTPSNTSKANENSGLMSYYFKACAWTT